MVDDDRDEWWSLVHWAITGSTRPCPPPGRRCPPSSPTTHGLPQSGWARAAKYRGPPLGSLLPGIQPDRAPRPDVAGRPPFTGSEDPCELLDEQMADVRVEPADVLRSSADSAGEVHARDVAAERLSRRLRRLESAEEGLVFGRIDGSDGTVLHIGRLGLHVDDPDCRCSPTGERKWRAPSTRRRPSTRWDCDAAATCVSITALFTR